MTNDNNNAIWREMGIEWRTNHSRLLRERRRRLAWRGALIALAVVAVILAVWRWA